MTKEKVLIVGLGEVGRPLFELIKESGEYEVYGLDLDEARMKTLEQISLSRNIDIMHVCLPCSKKEKFITIVKNYIERFRPRLTIINSTVPPGTSMELCKTSNEAKIAYSPIRGEHKEDDTMKWEIKH